MATFKNCELIGSIQVIIQNENTTQLHSLLSSLSPYQVSELLLQLDTKDLNKFWDMIPIQ